MVTYPQTGNPEIPVILCDEWSEAQVKAFRLMVNRSVAWAEWDEDLLSLGLIDLKNLDFDIDLTGFDDEELARLLAAQDATAGLCDEDAAPAPPQMPISALGDGGAKRRDCRDLGLYGIGAFPGFALGGCDRQTHFLAHRTRQESANRMGLPVGNFHQFLQGCAVGPFQKVEHLDGFAAATRAPAFLTA
jgi:hypothetical protein